MGAAAGMAQIHSTILACFWEVVWTVTKKAASATVPQRMRGEKKKKGRRMMLRILEPQIIYYSYYTDGSNSLTISLLRLYLVTVHTCIH